MNQNIDFIINEEKTNNYDIERFSNEKCDRKIAYIASPYSGDIESNVEFARRCCHWVYENTDFIPIAPHLLFPQFLDNDNARERFTATLWNQKLLRDTNFLLVFGEEITSGMEEEIQYYTEYLDRNRIIYFKEKAPKHFVIMDGSKI